MKTLLLTALLIPQLVFAADNLGEVGKKRTQQFIDLLMKVKQAEGGKALSKAE